MAADVDPCSPNPCCALWIKRSQKLEKSRDALRQSVKILEGQIEKQSLQIASLKKEVEEQKMQREQHKVERMKEANIKKQLEKEIQDMKVNISSLESTKSLNGVDVDEIGMLKTRILRGEEEVKCLKELLEKERRKTDSERRKTEAEKKKAAEAWKLLKEEKRKTQEQKCFVEAEQKKAEEFRLSMEKFKVEANEVRGKLNAEIVRAHDAKKQIEVEKMKAFGEKKRADSEMEKVEKQKSLFEEESKRALDLKSHADHLCLKLEEERRKREGMLKKLEVMSVVPSFGEREQNVCKTLKAAELKLLKQRLKLERKRMKHAERVAKQEKYEKKFVMKEVHLLKQNLMQILYRLNLLDDLVSHEVGSTDGALKVLNSSDWKGLKLNDLLRSKKNDFNYEAEFGPSEIHHVGPFTCADPVGGECIGLPVSRGCCDRSKTGIMSELESPVGGFLRNKSQSSAVCSTSMHFSDRKLMGSQGRDSVVDISTAKLAKKANHSLTVLESLGEVVKIGVHKSCQVFAKDSDGSASSECVRKQPCSNLPTFEAVDQVTDHKSKKRKIQNSSRSVAWLHSEDNRLHSNVGDKLSTINDQVRKVGSFALTNCSQSPAVFKDIDYEKFCQKGGQSDLYKMNDAHMMTQPSTDNQIEKQIVKLGNKKKTSKLVSKYNRDTCCNQVSGPDEFVINQAATSFGNIQADLTSFENIISGGCLKLLELDNDNDEERYRSAMDMPLSPTLPESEIRAFQLGGEDDSHALLEKDSLVCLCSSDVMDLEISSSDSKPKILINKELSNKSVAEHDVLHDITHDSFLADNGGSLDLGHIDHARKPETEPGMIPLLMETNRDREGHHVGHSLAEPNKIELEVVPVSEVSIETIAKGYKKPQPSTDAAGGFSRLSHSQLFHEGECSESCALDNLHLAEHSSSCGGSLNKILGDCQLMNSNLIQIQPEVKTIDSAFAQNVNRIVPSDVKRLTKGNSFVSEKGTEQNFQLPLHSLSISEAAKPTPSFSSWEVKYLFEGNDEPDPGRYLCYITSFSSARDMDSLSRILSALNAFTPENFTASDIDLLLVDVLNGLKLEDLQSEEKVSVLFSFLLGNLSARMLDHCKHIAEEDSFQFLESFSLEIVRAISAGNTKHIFDEMFQLDILFWLMENFLIEKEVLVIREIEQHPSCLPALPDYKFHLDVGNKCVHSKDVSISQFLAGCTILASICVAADDIGYLLVVSYKILRTHQDDISWVLIALHAFANICGKRFFNIDGYSFLVTTMKSVISLLEEGLKPGSCPLPLFLNSTSGIVADFSPCKQCPFSMDAICMDKLIGLLLDVLEDYSLTVSDNQNTEKYFISSDGKLSSRATLNKDTDYGKSESDVHCDSSCAIFRYGKITSNQSGCSSAMAFCNFTDIISLVELVGHYVSWEWTFKEVMPRLLKMLEGCIREDFSAALFVLVGELGRPGISCGGYQGSGVAELRCKVTMLLDTFIARKADLSTQFAAVGALINLLPLNFQDVVNKNQDFTLDTCESAHVRYIQKWAFQLDEEQRAALKNIFDK